MTEKIQQKEETKRDEAETFECEKSWLYDTRAGKYLKNVLFGIGIMALGIFLLFPLYWMVATSLKTTGEIQAVPPTILPIDPSLQAYQLALEKKPFGRFLMNSLGISVGAGVLALVIGIPAAYTLSQQNFLGKRAIMSLLLSSLMFPGTAIMVPVWQLVNSLGIYNSRVTLILLYAAMTSPFVVWLMKGFFDDFPSSLIDAARMDQCSTYETFRYVIAPMSINSIIASFIFASLLAWNELVFALTLINDQSKFTVPVAMLDFVTGFNQQWNDIAAASIMVSIPVLLALIYIQRYFVEGMTGGAIKG